MLNIEACKTLIFATRHERKSIFTRFKGPENLPKTKKIRCKIDAQKSRENRRQNGSQNEGKCVQKSIWSRHWAPISGFWRLLELCKNMMNFWCVSGGQKIEKNNPRSAEEAPWRPWPRTGHPIFEDSGPQGGAFSRASTLYQGTKEKSLLEKRKVGYFEKEIRLF